LGAKGGAEGNVMTTPVCLANAVCDALGVDHIDLPMTPAKISRHIHGEEPPPPARSAAAAERTLDIPSRQGRALAGAGSVRLPASPQAVWEMLIDPKRLARLVPGCKELMLAGDNRYAGVVSMGAGPVKGEFKLSVGLTDLDPPNSLVLAGGLSGPLGTSNGRGQIRLQANDDQTVLSYDYQVEISGKVTSIGGRMIDSAARMLIKQFFAQMVRQLQPGGPSLPRWRRIARALGLAR